MGNFEQQQYSSKSTDLVRHYATEMEEAEYESFSNQTCAKIKKTKMSHPFPESVLANWLMLTRD